MADRIVVYNELIGDVDTPTYPCITVERGSGTAAIYGVKRYPITYRFYETSDEGDDDEPTDLQVDIIEARTDNEALANAVDAAAPWQPVGASGRPVNDSNFKTGSYVTSN